jgi:endo-1,4-beta-mannosidase
MKIRLVFIGIIMIASFGCDYRPPQPPPPWSWPAITGFMTASGTGFADGFTFMGANLDPWRFITAVGEIYSQAEIEDWVANAILYTHARVIRVHMNGRAFEPAIGTDGEPAIGTDGEPAFMQLDYLLAAAAKYNVYVLIDFRDYCWSPWPPNNELCNDPYWYMNGGSPSNLKKDNILNFPDAITAFKNCIYRVVNRMNTVTGVKYKDDWHIFGWEIINEPNMIPDIKTWFTDLSTYVKSVDTNHLVGVALGDLGQGDPNWDDLKVAQLDFIDFHYYADLYNPGNTNWAARYNQILATIMTLGKPVINGEFGYYTNFARSRISNLYQTITTASFSGGLSGVMPYSWGPPGPNYFGDVGSFCIYTGDAGLCELLRDLAP